MSLPDPPEDFIGGLENEMYTFLWDGKNSRIKKSVICKEYSAGGLGMLNIRNFITSLKVSWLKKLRVDSDWRESTFNMFPDLNNLDKRGSEFANVLITRYDNLFWKDVLRHYKKVSSKCDVSTLDEFLAECIHYNIHIVRDRKVIFVKEWCDAGIFWIRQLLNDTGSFMNYDEFRQRYPTIVRTNFLMYEGIITAIKEYRRTIDIELSNEFKIFEPKVWHIVEKGKNHIKSLLSNSGAIPTAVTRWNEKYINLSWKQIFIKCIKSSSDMQLRWFQMRLLHRILPTEKYLHSCKIVESPLCSFCKAENETIDHLFFQCRKTKLLWDRLLALINDKCIHVHNLHFDVKLIIFGMSEGIATDRGLERIILWTKFYVYKCKMQKTEPTFQALIQSMKYRWKNEKYISILNNSHGNFNRIWVPYLSLFE